MTWNYTADHLVYVVTFSWQGYILYCIAGRNNTVLIIAHGQERLYHLSLCLLRSLGPLSAVTSLNIERSLSSMSSLTGWLGQP